MNSSASLIGRSILALSLAILSSCGGGGEGHESFQSRVDLMTSAEGHQKDMGNSAGSALSPSAQEGSGRPSGSSDESAKTPSSKTTVAGAPSDRSAKPELNTNEWPADWTPRKMIQTTTSPSDEGQPDTVAGNRAIE